MSLTTTLRSTPRGGRVNTETPFFKTAMGRDFFDRNVPALVKQLTRLNDNLEKLIKQSDAEKEDKLGDASP